MGQSLTSFYTYQLKRKNIGGDGSKFIDDGSIWMGLTDQDMWTESGRIWYERTKVDRPKGYVALIWSLCGLQGILNGNNLRLTINLRP